MKFGEINPTVSVVVPVYNGENTICGTVDAVLNQTLLPVEIIVVDDGSTDNTLEVLRKYGYRVNVLSKPNGGPASARNRGIVAATGKYVAFTDSDCVPDERWIENLLKKFDDPRVAGVGGHVRGADAGGMSQYADMIHLLDPAKHEDESIRYLVTANACFRRDVLCEVGLFNELFRKPGGEEPEICKKMSLLGYEFREAEDAIVLHHHKQTLKVFFKTITNYGEGAYILSTMFPEYELKGDVHKLLASRVFYVPVRTRTNKGLKYAKEYGVRRALLFSFLDHFFSPAFIWGYLRGKRSDAANG